MCPLCQANVSSLAGDVSSLRRGRPGWGWGADARRDSSFGKLRTGRFGRLRTGFGGLRTGLFGRLAMNARGVGSQGCGPGFDLTGRG